MPVTDDKLREGDGDTSSVSIAETMAAPEQGLVAPPPGTSAVMSGPARIAGRYEILNLLGTGGMGAVYRARDAELDEMVALKVLRRELSDSPSMLARFRQEAKLARRVTHRNVARTFDIGEHAGEKFLTMEFVDGESLASYLAQRGRLSVGEASHVGGEVLAGMSAAHAAGVVHRDLKPDNVLMGKDGRIVVTDFGIAHAAVSSDAVAKTMGGIVGTPAYMAPEQVEGAADIDARADVYAFGAMLYELLTGARAWPGDAPLVVAAARLIKPPPDPRDAVATLPAALADVVLRCMARARPDRFATADDVMTALYAAVSQASTSELELAPTSSYVAAAEQPLSPEDVGAAVARDKTIAVLPFKNGGPPGDEYLADGITDDLIDVLSMTPGLKVRPRGAVAHLGKTEVDPRLVGEELGVQVVVLGSVRKTADTIRVTARLVSTSDGFQLWARRFDRPASDVLEVNDEAARAIAEALTVAAPVKARVAPTNAAAIDLYLRAQHEYHQFWRENVVKAVDLYEQALRLAPNDPTILAGCARARVRIAFFGGEGAKESLALAHQAADRAVAGAPELGESWVALAAARRMGGDAPGAARALVTALHRSKGLAPAHDLLGRLLLEVKSPAPAMFHLRTALAIDPSDMAPRFELCRAHALLRQWADADALLDLPVADHAGNRSRFIFRSRLCLWSGVPHSDLANPPELGPEMGLFGDVRVMNGFLTEHRLPQAMRDSLMTIARTQAAGTRRRAFFFQLNAEVFTYISEIDRAFEALSEAIDSELIDVVWMDLCPALDPLRKDPRFAPLRALLAPRAEAVVAALTE